MIQASELRIGNLVESNGVTYEVISIEANGNIRGVEGGTTFNLDGATTPIPLTEEWLVRFGFGIVHESNKHYSIFIQRLGDYRFHVFLCPSGQSYWVIAFSDNISGKNADYITKTRIKQVHQLQNLYFALTGEELKLQP